MLVYLSIKILHIFSDNNAASTPNRNITQKKSSIQIPNTQEINIDAAIKDIFDLSCKIADVVVSMSKS